MGMDRDWRVTMEPAAPGVRQCCLEGTRDREAQIGKSCSLPFRNGGLLSMLHLVTGRSKSARTLWSITALLWSQLPEPCTQLWGWGVVTELHRVKETSRMANHTRETQGRLCL